MKFALICLAGINVFSGLTFSLDKNAAINGRRRVSEQTLHLLEILGGVFMNLLLMYILRHKNRKFSYYMWTWMIMVGWIVAVSLLVCNKYNINIINF